MIRTANSEPSPINGALLVNKDAGISSFGVIELLQQQWMDLYGCKKRDVPKLGHGGTLDPFATGLLIVLVGSAVKLARYFLGATKSYDGTLRFGETSIPGDPTGPISETSSHIPTSLQELTEVAHRLTLTPYLQIPPMHSAKKLNGKPLYELARAGLEVEREPKLCNLYEFSILNVAPPRAQFHVKCSSGTYIRTLTQDYARLLGSVALLETLHRTSSGVFDVKNSRTVKELEEAGKAGQKWNEMPCWIPFDDLLEGYSKAPATVQEKNDLYCGKQFVIHNLLKKASFTGARSSERETAVAVYYEQLLVGVLRKENELWRIERVFQR